MSTLCTQWALVFIQVNLRNNIIDELRCGTPPADPCCSRQSCMHLRTTSMGGACLAFSRQTLKVWKTQPSLATTSGKTTAGQEWTDYQCLESNGENDCHRLKFWNDNLNWLACWSWNGQLAGVEMASLLVLQICSSNGEAPRLIKCLFAWPDCWLIINVRCQLAWLKLTLDCRKISQAKRRPLSRASFVCMGMMRPPPPSVTAKTIQASKMGQWTRAKEKPAPCPMMVQKRLLHRMPLELLKAKYNYLRNNSAAWMLFAVHWLRFDFVWPTFFKLFSLLFSLNSEVALKHRLGRGHAEDHSPMVGAPFELRLKLTQIKLSPRSSVLTLTVGITRRHACKERAFGKWAGQSMSCNKLNVKYRQQTGQKTLTVFGQFVVSYFVSYYVLLLPTSWPLSRFWGCFSCQQAGMWPASWPLFAIFLILNRCVSATLAHWSWLFEFPWILILAKISLKIPKKTAWMFPRMVVSLAWMLHWHLIWAIFSACDASSAWENACYASAAWGNACDDASSAWENACYASAAWGNACDDASSAWGNATWSINFKGQ